MNHPEALQVAPQYVERFFAQPESESLKYHNLDHTQQVVQRAGEIADAEQLSADDKAILQMAAWFHDLGHLNGGLEQHEQRGADLFKKFIAEQKIDDKEYEQRVISCILATKMPHHPHNKLEEIMCDADVYHFGTPLFQKTNKAVKEEFEARGYKGLTKGWTERALNMLQQQHFYTRFCNDTLEAGKNQNIALLKEKLLKKGIVPQPPKPVKTPKPAKDPAAEEEKAQQKNDKSLIARGAQTLLRLGSSNHLDLSRMADGKANILISVNSIIISVILSVFLDRLDVDTYLTIPTILFLSSSVATVIIAILATRPKLTEGEINRQQVLEKKTNLLFFGNFYKSSLEDFQWSMNYLLNDRDYLYGTMVMDIYFIGKVLGRKYKLIRLAYNVFMIGLIVSVLAFSIAFTHNAPSGHVTIIDGGKSPY